MNIMHYPIVYCIVCLDQVMIGHIYPRESSVLYNRSYVENQYLARLVLTYRSPVPPGHVPRLHNTGRLPSLISTKVKVKKKM